ncbi:antiviral reverse transcriptase Drt5 [Vibrio nomapromontoriensis]|uniref:antiviral reverse transcriptase Drt5 n=1 Tax=Vibrio nomapromontoriensis TaxID=2910246 RepID=UPI003D0CC9E5
MANGQGVKQRVISFYLDDFEKALFPLETCKFMIENSYDLLDKYVQKIADDTSLKCCFLPQQVVHASKPKHHLRRTKKLDPVAEFYIYHFCYKFRHELKSPKLPNRKVHGYHFKGGSPVSISDAFQSYNEEIEELKGEYNYHIHFDIASYFNSIYHHDLVNCVASRIDSVKEVELFGKFMREINAGFSIDFLPHGIYPTKMLGSSFLSYIDNSAFVKSEVMTRFMDDFFIASNSLESVMEDFHSIQKLLGQKSLNINANKTKIQSDGPIGIENQARSLVSELLNLDVGQNAFGSGIGDLSELEVIESEKIDELIKLADGHDVTDQDANYILEALKHLTDDLHIYLIQFANKNPSLMKKVFLFCAKCEDMDELANGFLDLVQSTAYLSEYQLFWIAKITETYLLDAKNANSLVRELYSHRNSTPISKAKILEIPTNKFGLQELREANLKNGTSSWLSWASAVGSRNESKIIKDYLMKYFMNVSDINNLIGSAVKSYSGGNANLNQ